MKTNIYNFHLMSQGQVNKEVIYNDFASKIDNMLSMSAFNFIEEKPDLFDNKLYLLNNADKNQILIPCFFNNNWEILDAKNGMIFYVIEKNSFYYFYDEWRKINFSSEGTVFHDFYHSAGAATGSSSASHMSDYFRDREEEYARDQRIYFQNLKDDFLLDSKKSFYYFYMTDNATISFSDTNQKTINIIIKQNSENLFDLKFSSNILWNNIEYKIIQKANHIDYLRFHKLPETPHFLAEIVGAGYSY